MTDKLIELIEEYGKLCGLDRGSSYDILTKAKQAIIDYHDKKVQKAANPFSNTNVDNIGEIAKKIYKQGQREAIKQIVETCERYELLKDKFRKYNFTEMDAKYYYDILDELVKAIKQTIANVDGKGESDEIN